MDKAKAKQLASELIERDLVPQVQKVGDGYTITVNTGGLGVTTAQIQLVETNLSIEAKVHLVTFL